MLSNTNSCLDELPLVFSPPAEQPDPTPPPSFPTLQIPERITIEVWEVKLGMDRSYVLFLFGSKGNMCHAYYRAFHLRSKRS
ncbi:MAG TPA: hypothetical protein VEP90_22585 [Methylomirabilota bacterium]|nr:hypothetical protein [Methylomirabilota bacterium]